MSLAASSQSIAVVIIISIFIIIVLVLQATVDTRYFNDSTEGRRDIGRK